MECGSIGCTEELDYTLLKRAEVMEGLKKTYYYAGVKCPTCTYAHRISPLYRKQKEAKQQVEAHNERVK